ncbi:MAG: helix-turn-helix domain-containing protein [Flavonifractor plautii]
MAARSTARRSTFPPVQGGGRGNFSSYLTRYRLERAQELLQTTDLPVASVAVQTGYTTPGYFSRLYKKYKGVSPEAERRGSKS